MRPEQYYGGAANLDLGATSGTLVPNYRVVSILSTSDAIVDLYDPVLKHAPVGPGLHFLHELDGNAHSIEYNSQSIGMLPANGTVMIWYDGTEWKVDILAK